MFRHLDFDCFCKCKHSIKGHSRLRGLDRAGLRVYGHCLRCRCKDFRVDYYRKWTSGDRFSYDEIKDIQGEYYIRIVGKNDLLISSDVSGEDYLIKKTVCPACNVKSCYFTDGLNRLDKHYCSSCKQTVRIS